MDEKNINNPKRRSLRIIFILIIMILCVLAGGGIARYGFWQDKMALPAEEKARPVIEIIEPIYVPLNSFTVSLKPTDEESDRVLYLGLTVSFTDTESSALLAKFMPEYRSRLFMLFTQQTYEALSTDEGKNNLIISIKHELSQPLVHQQVLKPTEVLINEFILR